MSSIHSASTASDRSYAEVVRSSPGIIQPNPTTQTKAKRKTTKETNSPKPKYIQTLFRSEERAVTPPLSPFNEADQEALLNNPSSPLNSSQKMVARIAYEKALKKQQASRKAIVVQLMEKVKFSKDISVEESL